MDRAELLRNLLIMAATDGSFTTDEMRLLSDRCVEWGITDEQFQKSLDIALSGRGEIVIPPSPQDRVEFLKELVLMMAADGHLAEREKHLFAGIAGRMKVSEVVLNRLIDDLLRPDDCP